MTDSRGAVDLRLLLAALLVGAVAAGAGFLVGLWLGR